LGVGIARFGGGFGDATRDRFEGFDSQNVCV
jgi:hypothetical protein